MMELDNKAISYFKGKNGTKVDVESIRKELAQFLQMDNLNFLIGAGCSSHVVDEAETGIPGMAKLYEDFFEEYSDFKIAGEDVKSKFNGNLESMLETMGGIVAAEKVKIIDENIGNKIKTVQKFIRKKIINGLHGEAVLQLYRNFYIKTVFRGRKSPINIFTTNYDLYNEQALDLLSFPYNNGFVGTYKRSFNPASYKYAYVEDMNLSKHIWERVPNFYNLYKLHGSISWVKDRTKIREIDYNHISEDDTVMIYPTPLKDRSTLMTPYSDLFRAMETALLRKNSVLITLGYSFADDHINRLILNSLAIPTFKLVIFGQSDAIKKLIDMDDSRIIVISSDDKIHYFKNFVEKAMPDIQEDVKEKIDIDDFFNRLSANKGED